MDQISAVEKASAAAKESTGEQANATDKTDAAAAFNRTMHPSDLLRCVAGSMNWRDTEIYVTVPRMTTWKTVLRATDTALGDFDHNFMVTYPRTEAQRLKNRAIALEYVAAETASSTEQASSPLSQIRTKYDITSLPSPKPISEEARDRLKENAKPFADFRQPHYITFTANIIENKLPIVKGNIILRGLGSTDEDFKEEFELVDMLWDTGASHTIISEELLSEPFRRYLQDAVHDPYRSSNCSRVQLEGVIGLSNVPIDIAAVVLVVPKSVVPNQRVGIIFGQQQCIDHINYSSVPRSILKAKGEEIDDDTWGDLLIHEVINEDGDLVQV